MRSARSKLFEKSDIGRTTATKRHGEQFEREHGGGRLAALKLACGQEGKKALSGETATPGLEELWSSDKVALVSRLCPPKGVGVWS